IMWRRRSMGFATEPRLELRVSGQIRAHHFDGNGSAQAFVTAQIDVGHSASTYQFADFVTAIDNALLGHGFPYEALGRVSSAIGWGSSSFTGSTAGLFGATCIVVFNWSSCTTLIGGFLSRCFVGRRLSWLRCVRGLIWSSLLFSCRVRFRLWCLGGRLRSRCFRCRIRLFCLLLGRLLLG